MSTRDYFNKGTPKVKASETQESAYDSVASDVESSIYVGEKSSQQGRYVPPIDFTSASNFARYGSAEEYYRNSFRRIYQQFPYDGTFAERTQFDNDSSFLDKYIFDNIYPRTNGHAIFSANGWGSRSGALKEGYGLPDSLEYISIHSGPNTSSAGMVGSTLGSAFGEVKHRTSPGANIFDTDIYGTEGVNPAGRQGTRESNLLFDLSKGITTEFWFNKGDWITSKTKKEVIFDLWNGQSSGSYPLAAPHINPAYGRLLVYATASDSGINPFRVHLASGSSVWDMSFGGSTVTTESISGSWNHFAFTFFSSSADSQLQSKFYINGDLVEDQTTTNKPFGQVTGSLIGHIGALQTAPSGNAYAGTSMTGYGKLAGSLDEFRYWKAKRTSKDIGRNWFTQVGAGTNNDISNTELGVYYKFNEGISGVQSQDSKVLDYSGRISNGTWVGYAAGARNVGSAIVSASAASSEYKDPILYSSHADVISKLDQYVSSGSVWDTDNNGLLYNSYPTFLQEEEEDYGAQHLKQLTQIIGSYFDELHHQIEALPSLVTETYTTASAAPFPHQQKMLQARGFNTPRIFDDASTLEWFHARNEDKGFELDLEEIKNRIYQNIFNNLSYIYKSKGTEESLRNLIRCYGVDDELIKINLYSDQLTFPLVDSRRSSVAKKRFVNFNSPENFAASVYQQTSSGNTNTTDVTYISGTDANLANTAEIEVLFPRKVSATEGNQQYFSTSFLTSSIFGCHSASWDPLVFTWDTGSAAHDFNFELYAVRPEEESSDAHFLLKDRAGNFSLTSSLYGDVYDNQKWNFSVRLRNENHPVGSSITGSTLQSASLEFKGINVISDMVANEFTLTASLTSSYLTANRRYYVGAHLTNFTGAVNFKSDVRATSLRHWASYLDDETLLAHAKDPENYGSSGVHRSTYLGTTLDGMQIPQFETLALNWDFSTVNSSSTAGIFTVDDFSSGSSGLRTRYPGSFGNIVGNQYTGQGIGFPASSTSSVVTEYLQSARLQPPESVSGLDMISIPSVSDANYHRESRIDNSYFTFEKNMYQTISEEMLNMFGTIVEFNSLIGAPVNRYREGYKGLDKLRNLFFERVQNAPDIDKYIEYYKWIDSSLSEMILQLIPASVGTSEGILNVIESHILERNKYRAKFPMIKEVAATEGGIKGYQEQNYSWRLGHAPLPDTAATATITITDYTELNAGDKVNLIATDGTNYDFEQGDQSSVNGTFEATTSNNQTATNLMNVINTSSGPSGTRFTATVDGAVVTVTQATAGEAGNTTVTLTDSGTAGMTKTNFTGGSTPQNQNTKWWRERAESDSPALTTGDAIINSHRRRFRQRRHYHASSSAPFLYDSSAGSYESSVYKARSLTKVFDFSSDIKDAIRNRGVSFANQKKTYYRGLISFGSTDGLVMSNVQSELDSNDVINTPKELEKKKKYFTVTGERNQAHAPFTIYSSSVPTGYASELTSDFMSGVDITNNHVDNIPVTNEISMQGPFAERFVGGSPHRHADINRHDGSKLGPGNLDSAVDRIEAYELSLATGQITVKHQGVNKPRSSYYRDEATKRPVNTRNIRQTTSSVTDTVSGTLQSSIGNFSKKYEVIMASDRATNNSSFVKAGGFSSSSVQSVYGTLLNDYIVPVRAKSEHTIVGRFSSPGGPETSTPCFLDLESGQYSAYNDMNTRNWGVRKPLRDLLSERVERFGIRSGSSTSADNYSVAAGFHKTNRNRLTRVEYSTFADTHVSASTYDNWYVQHPIPRSDLQYSWISSSYSSSYVYGHAAKDGYYSGSNEGVVPAILFTSASNDATSGIKVDHLGINSLIVEPISSSDARIGYPLGTPISTYKNTAIANVGAVAATATITITDYTELNAGDKVNLVATDGTSYDFTNGDQSSVNGTWESTTSNNQTATNLMNVINTSSGPAGTRFTATVDGAVVTVTQATAGTAGNTTVTLTDSDTAGMTKTNFTGGDDNTLVFNSLFLQRGGIYGFSSWKQIANSYNPLVRAWKKENTIAFNSSPGDMIITESPKYEAKQSRFGSLQAFTEPPITSRNFPLRLILDVNTVQGEKKAEIESVFGNEIDNFTNMKLDQALYMYSRDGVAYNKIKSMYLDGALDSKSSPVEGFRSLEYKQNIYPRAQNSFLAKTRSRPGYTNNFWRDSRVNRDTLGDSKFGSSDHLSGAYSSWNMDADTDFATVITGTTAGMLQNNKTHVHNSLKTNITASALFHRKHTVAASASVKSRTGKEVSETGSWAAGTGFVFGCVRTNAGNALWQAGSQAGHYDITGVLSSSPAYPWVDSYDDYVLDPRAHNKDYSIVPEFRISDHIENYVNNRDGDFLSHNASFLSIKGATSSNPQNSSEGDFYKVYANSDFMKQFCIIREDHRDFVNPLEIKLTCKAIKKFVPYNGFYPSELLSGLYTRFSSSYAHRVSYTGADAVHYNAKIRPFITPLFAPGIWNNMIKSGMAVDYPVFTGSYVVHRPYTDQTSDALTDYYLLSTGSSAKTTSGYMTDSFVRIPFEATIAPEKYLANMPLLDMEPHPSSSLNVTASWAGDGDGLYKMKAHNALASMVEFFLPGQDNKGEMSTLYSAPESEWKPFISGTTYAMRVRLRKSYNQSRQEQQLNTNNFPTPHDTDLDIDNGLEQTITICSRPTSFGPPMCGRQGTHGGSPLWVSSVANSFGSSYYGALDSLTGVNPAFEPPYANGEAWADIVYKHDDEDTQPTLEKIQSRGTVVQWRFDPYALSSSNGGSNLHPYGFNNINDFSMQLTSSINVLGKIRMPTVTQDSAGNTITSEIDTTQKTNVWAIQPKMEVPILNFHNASASVDTPASASVPRSIWSQFGVIPTGSTGIYLEVGDIERSWSDHRIKLFDSAGANANPNYDSDAKGNDTRHQPYFELYGGYGAQGLWTPPSSLADHLGFKKKSEKLGKLAKSRTVKEAIVAIPFLEKKGKREFFEIPKKEIATSLSLLEKGAAESNSVTDMVSKMKEYVFPPKFDFIKYPDDITPFAMYIFEFKHKFDQDDLSYIWQGLQPRSAASMQMSDASIEHKLLAGELMGKAAKETGEPLQSEVRWMVFKVKQKAADNYYKKVVGNQSSTATQTPGLTVGEEIPEYSYNWPYDYFSLVEFAKIDASVKFAPTKSGPPSDDDDSFVIRTSDPCAEDELVGAIHNMVQKVVEEQK